LLAAPRPPGLQVEGRKRQRVATLEFPPPVNNPARWPAAEEKVLSCDVTSGWVDCLLQKDRPVLEDRSVAQGNNWGSFKLFSGFIGRGMPPDEDDPQLLWTGNYWRHVIGWVGRRGTVKKGRPPVLLDTGSPVSPGKQQAKFTVHGLGHCCWKTCGARVTNGHTKHCKAPPKDRSFFPSTVPSIPGPRGCPAQPTSRRVPMGRRSSPRRRKEPGAADPRRRHRTLLAVESAGTRAPPAANQRGGAITL